ncbi:hypothetical protein M2103_001743 [Ereboglobus sp. PH5-5]|uniref:hypothetical protein n=1 Tax=unclassified Ereboglobus TaxID=2626932 RepID=UPI0024065200|nr:MULTISPECIES: hypothetical protein [unclassified Ereboglobus]MDF9826612.1 hypothetical protein [Ereboglobus sp. PH5-10]MDF9833516.1 hypothetical protein [Ereboglobus sp. PH5-5]
MTRKGTTARRRETEPSALALIEESAHLLRRAPAGVFVLHLLGAGAWALAVLFAWAYVSWFRPSRDELALGACALVLLYAWMKVAQAEMCARLLAFRLGAKPEKFTWRRAARLAVSQFKIHAWGPAALAVSGVLLLPFGYVWLYFQTATALGSGQVPEQPGAAGADVWRLAKLWPRQGHVGLLVISALSLVVFANVAALFYMLPWLARTLLGMENFMSLDGWSMLNTTFLMCVTALTWLAVDPLAKAFCVLRVFRGRALRTGADLRIEIAAARKQGRAKTGFTLVALLAGALMFSGDAPAAEQDSDSVRQQQQQVQPAELDQAIDEVLARSDFQWQLQPDEKARPSDDEASAIERFFNWMGSGVKSVFRALGRFVEWLANLLSSDNDNSSPVVMKERSGTGDLSLLKFFLYTLLAVLAGLLVWVIYITVRGGRRKIVEAAAGVAEIEGKPDLRDENVQAAQLPWDEWLQLAREQIALGEWRLALRALYLAQLARLGAEGLLTLRRHKTNLDYERELRRRALQRAGLPEWFAARRREFEAAWYGREQTDEARVRAWFDEMEKGAKI